MGTDYVHAELDALRHDIERHVAITAEQAQEMERLRQDLAAARALLREIPRGLMEDSVVRRIDAALAKDKP
jgi:uncharacterized protein involved in exopolysaccharide biosynthesis